MPGKPGVIIDDGGGECGCMPSHFAGNPKHNIGKPRWVTTYGSPSGTVEFLEDTSQDM
jgi:hypothetical protein